MHTDDLDHIAELRSVVLERLQALEVQAAHFGPAHLPAHLRVEMREARAELEQYDTLLRAPLHPAAAAHLSDAGRYAVLIAKLDVLEQQITTNLQTITQVNTRQNQHISQLQLFVLLLVLLLVIGLVW